MCAEEKIPRGVAHIDYRACGPLMALLHDGTAPTIYKLTLPTKNKSISCKQVGIALMGRREVQIAFLASASSGYFLHRCSLKAQKYEIRQVTKETGDRTSKFKRHGGVNLAYFASCVAELAL
jgi:hypothetical protein